MANKNFAIGDIQGCLTELRALLKKIEFDPNQDQLWLCGDLINRGPDSLGVIQFLMSLPKTPKIVLGNHDLHFLAVASNAVPIKKEDTFDDILNSSDCDKICAWLKSHHLIYTDPILNFTMVHAGILPAWTLEETHQYANEIMAIIRSKQAKYFFENMYGEKPNIWQTDLIGIDRLRFITNSLTRMRFCKNMNTYDLKIKTGLEEQPQGIQPWFKFSERKTRGNKIIFGHWAALMGKAHTKNIYALDTGCVWGAHLTAMRLEDETLFSMPSKITYKIKNEG